MTNSDNKMKFETADLTAENVAKIEALFPGAVAEGKVNFDLLRTMLGDKVSGDEAYEFTWVGKRAAIAEAGRPIRKTLRPCPEESRDWDTTENLYIEGDNLDVLKLLQESYLGKVKMVYIDPPYNTGNDFIYRDNFAQSREEYDEEAGVYDEDGNRLFRNQESNGRFHSDWCSMIYPRLVLARNLLRDDGVAFVHIDDREVTQLRKICDEVFGESNYLAEFPRVTKKGGKSSDVTAKNHDYILLYAKNAIRLDLTGISHTDSGYSKHDEFFDERGYYKANQTLDYDSLGYVKTLDYPIEIDGETFIAGGNMDMYEQRQQGQHGRADWGWRWSKDLFDFGLANGFIEVHRGGARPRIYTKTYQNVSIEKVGGAYQIVKIDRTKPLSTLEFTDNKYSNDNAKKAFDAIMQKAVFEYTKPPELLMQLARLVNGSDFTVLDFFSGSATTAHAVMQLNAEDGGKRKFIMVQLPEVCDGKSEAAKAGYSTICEIGKERIRRAGTKIKAEADPSGGGLDVGFRVLKLDDTNMNDVYYAAGEYEQDMLTLMQSNIKKDRTDMDLLFGCLLDWGLPLSMPHTRERIEDFTVHTYNDGDLIACFEEKVPENVVREIAGRQPLRAVFRDNSFTSSPEKINVFEIFKLLAPNTTVKVI
jgi:adenine-specific DNA-methyltransferase